VRPAMLRTAGAGNRGFSSTWPQSSAGCRRRCAAQWRSPGKPLDMVHFRFLHLVKKLPA
jgi:hypothetical protein